MTDNNENDENVASLFEDYGQALLRESREMDAVSAYPPEYTSPWYRLRYLEEMTPEQMKSMLAFLSGYDATGWDRAYAQSGAKEIVPVEDDPVYNETYLSEWYDERKDEKDKS